MGRPACFLSRYSWYYEMIIRLMRISISCSRSVTRLLSWIALSRLWLIYFYINRPYLLANIFVFIAECWYVVIIFLCIEIISFKTLDLIYYDSIFLSHFYILYGINFFCYQIHVGLYKSISRPLTSYISSPNLHRWVSRSVTGWLLFSHKFN